VNTSTPVLAAGAVVWRTVGDAVDVLLVHRPRYDDWSFPKGKLDPGEHALAAAVREVAEETGVRTRLGLPLPTQEYDASGVAKRVHYWAARPADGSGGQQDVNAYVPNKEVDRVTWCPIEEARRRLTYPRDVDVLEAFGVSAYRSEPLVVLRHAQALPRGSWTGPDHERALAPEGEEQASALVPLLQAYGIRRLLSSDAVRCTTSVQPYADAAGLRVEVDHRLSEQGCESVAVSRRMRRLLEKDAPLLVCSHRPVLPEMFRALGVRDPALHPGELLVVHHEQLQVRATEQHRP
jgi:8-oxo-(d)GTP phosphatase